MKYTKLSVFQKPRCLVTSLPNGSLRIEENILNEVKEIKDHLVVVAMVGLYRTGKSFLLNRLTKSYLGFRVGRTIKPETKGIWILCSSHPTRPDSVLVLLDTEGLGNIKGDDDYDRKIYTLSVLLCDILCYNIMNAFDQDSIEKLARFSGQVLHSFGSFTSDFVLCVRDFSLQMEKNGKAISDDDYLSYCLASIVDEREETKQANRTKTFLKRVFPVRKCFTFDRPADRKKLQELEFLADKDLSQTFLEETDKFVGYINSRKPKLLPERVAVEGQIFSSLLAYYVEFLNAGDIPEMHEALSKVVDKENQELLQVTKSAFSEEMYHLRPTLMSSAKFDEISEGIVKNYLDDFRTKVRLDIYHKFENLLKDNVERIKEKSRRENLKLISNHSRSVLQEIYHKHIGDGSQFLTLGGHEEYRCQMQQVKDKYGEECRSLNSTEADLVFMTLMIEKSDIERKIILEESRMKKDKDYEEIEKLKREHENQIQEAIRKVREFQQQEENKRKQDKETQRQEFENRDKEFETYATETKSRLFIEQ